MAREKPTSEVKRERWAELRHDIRKTLKDPVVVFALVCAMIAAIGAPLFALSDVILAK